MSYLMIIAYGLNIKRDSGIAKKTTVEPTPITWNTL